MLFFQVDLDFRWDVWSFNLTQTGKLNGFKIYLVGCDYWKYLIKFIKKSLYKENMIDKEDLNIITLTDNIKQIEKRDCVIININIILKI